MFINGVKTSDTLWFGLVFIYGFICISIYIYMYNISLYKRLYEIHDTILCLFSFYVIGLPDHIICIIHD